MSNAVHAQRLAIALLAALALAACSQNNEVAAEDPGHASGEHGSSSSAGLPDGHIAAGEKRAQVKSEATKQSCIDCHGADGSGAMGPSLADGRWHFGGAPAEIFESIYQGRPEGMPAWGTLISSDQIWMLVTYLRSLEKNRNVTTENFTGATVERTGH